MEVKFNNAQPLKINSPGNKPVSFRGLEYQGNDSRLYIGNEVGNAISTAISTLILAPVVQFFSLKLFKTKDIIPENIVTDVANKMIQDNKLASKKFKAALVEVAEPKPTTVESLKNFFNDHFDTKLNTAWASKNRPSVILHEIGHAIDWNKSKISKILVKTRFWAIGAAGILVSSAFMYKKSDDPNNIGNKIDKHIGAISFLSFVPTLITEASASLKGLKYLKQHTSVSPEMIKNFKTRMVWAFGTYAATALLTPVAIKLGVMVKDKIVSGNNNQEMQQPYERYYN